ncbi:MAG: hypothetical protein Q8P82_01175 [bacterium]|nr:hypothetical protein [bacterium]
MKKSILFFANGEAGAGADPYANAEGGADPRQAIPHVIWTKNFFLNVLSKHSTRSGGMRLQRRVRSERSEDAS